MKKEYIVDTNILIDNPRAIHILRNGSENNVYIPNHVLYELDKLKSDLKRGSAASIAIKEIETNKEWLNFIKNKKSHSNYTVNADTYILEEIKNDDFLCNNGVFVTSDRLLRITADQNGIQTNDFLDSLPYLTDSEHHTGFFNYYTESPIYNNFTWVEGKPYFYNSEREYRLIDYEHSVWKIKPKNIYQNLAFELLLNNDLDIVTIQSKAGFGKTFLALAAAFELVLQTPKRFNKIFICKTSDEFGKNMGFLPGDVDEKFAPITRAVIDLIHKLHKMRPANRIFKDPKDIDLGFKKSKLELLPLAYIQGMNIENSILILDEAQNFSRNEMRGLATRCGENTRLFAIGDTRQVISNSNEHNNGLNWLVKLCTGQPNYGHLVLKGKRSRGPVTDLALKVGL